MMESLAHGDFNETWEDIIKSMKEENGNVELNNMFGELPPDLENQFSEENIQKLMEEVESNPEMANFMEGMMSSLVSKDILYDPLKEMRDQYGPWLESNKDKLTEIENKRYKEQYAIINQICATYESENVDTTKVLQLVQQMQETGQPPADIMKSLAPDLDFQQFSDNKQCSIM